MVSDASGDERVAVGQWLRRERERRGIGRQEMAGRLAVPEPFLAEIEHGDFSSFDQAVHVDVLFRLYARTLDTDVRVVRERALEEVRSAAAADLDVPAATVAAEPAVGANLQARIDVETTSDAEADADLGAVFEPTPEPTEAREAPAASAPAASAPDGASPVADAAEPGAPRPPGRRRRSRSTGVASSSEVPPGRRFAQRIGGDAPGGAVQPGETPTGEPAPRRRAAGRGATTGRRFDRGADRAPGAPATPPASFSSALDFSDSEEAGGITGVGDPGGDTDAQDLDAYLSELVEETAYEGAPVADPLPTDPHAPPAPAYLKQEYEFIELEVDRLLDDDRLDADTAEDADGDVAVTQGHGHAAEPWVLPPVIVSEALSPRRRRRLRVVLAGLTLAGLASLGAITASVAIVLAEADRDGFGDRNGLSLPAAIEEWFE